MLNRRQLLSRTGMGFGSVALAHLLQPATTLADQSATNPLAPKQPHFAPTAQRVIHLFMNGGPSHLDTFDRKPLLEKYHGKALPTSERTERKTGAAFASPFKFQRYGHSGLEISEIFPHISQSADDLCVIRSMHADVPNHEPSFMLMNCGDGRQARPSMGSWVTYGLGTDNQNLPGFIAMCPGGQPTVGAQNWISFRLSTRAIVKLVLMIRNSTREFSRLNSRIACRQKPAMRSMFVMNRNPSESLTAIRSMVANFWSLVA